MPLWYPREAQHCRRAREQSLSATQTEETRERAQSRGAAPAERDDPAQHTETHPPDTHDSHGVAAGSAARWWTGVLVGGVVTCPLAWLLSHAATLPFFIGVFFFALFGLVIGATVFRVAGGRRYTRHTVLLGTSLLVLFGWGASVVLESARFPEEVATFALEQSYDIGDETAQQFREGIAADTRQHLREHFPPGGVLGYAKWSLRSGRIMPSDVHGLRRPFRSGQAKFWWGFRITLSIALMAFGISSQTLPLVARAETSDTQSAPTTA